MTSSDHACGVGWIVHLGARAGASSRRLSAHGIIAWAPLARCCIARDLELRFTAETEYLPRVDQQIVLGRVNGDLLDTRLRVGVLELEPRALELTTFRHHRHDPGCMFGTGPLGRLPTGVTGSPLRRY